MIGLFGNRPICGYFCTAAYIWLQCFSRRILFPLQVLYQQDADTSSNHIYLTLITLLMLTEDDGFNKDLFQVKLPAVKWYKEKYLTDVTLGRM